MADVVDCERCLEIAYGNNLITCPICKKRVCDRCYDYSRKVCDSCAETSDES